MQWRLVGLRFCCGAGVAAEDDFPYDATDGACLTGIPTPYRVSAWSYVDTGSTIPEIGELKEALCKHGPLVVAVFATPSFQSYTGGVFDERNKGTHDAPVNHAVALIGWSDKKKAWLIKNSWGVGWGESAGYGRQRGFMWIEYGCNNVGYGAAWADVPIENAGGPPKGGR